jgi:Transcriptional regulatory protein, C terminal
VSILAELTIEKLRTAIRNNRISFPSQVPAFSGQPQPEIQWRMATLFFINKWSYDALSSRYGLSVSYVSVLIRQWAQRAIHLGYLQDIPPAVSRRVRGAAAPYSKRVRSVTPQSCLLGKTLIDLKTHRIRSEGQNLPLTPSECLILRKLVAKLNHTVSRYELVELLGDRHRGVHSLRPLIQSLRRKLEPDPAAPQYLVTEPTVGYRLQAGTQA